MVRDDPDSITSALTLIQQLVDKGRHGDALMLCQELLHHNPTNQHLLSLIVSLRMQSHWLALPLRPLQGSGWAGVAIIWLIAVSLINVAQSTGASWAYGVVGVYLGWVVYTWCYPPLMTRWLTTRGL
ncbi:MAG: hypothetical protein HOI95_27545 [Chromatiales bacterium]|nr:hypothetical protein [Chromatiales bacterium]